METMQADASSGPQQGGESGDAGSGTPSCGTLFYFNFRARGEPLRMVAAYAGLNLDQEIFTMSEWGTYKRRMPKGQVPCLRLPDGTMMPEMNDIMKHLAQLPSPAGRQLVVDAKQASIVSAVNGALLDSVAHITNMYPSSSAVTQSTRVRAQATQFFGEFGAMLGEDPFFGGGTPGYGDIGLWMLAEDCNLMVPNLLDDLGDKLKQWYERVAALPGLAEYLASRPQVGSGVYGMPGSILHGGIPPELRSS